MSQIIACALGSVRCQFDKEASGNYFLSMRAVGLKVLQKKLSEYIRLAARGETVLVTNRNRVVAEISPPRAERNPPLADAVLADVVRAGWLTPPLLVDSSSPPPLKPVAPVRQLLDELAADRYER